VVIAVIRSKRIVAALIFVAVAGSIAVGSEALAMKYPTSKTPYASDPFLYWLIRKHAFDLDAFLKSTMGIRASSCTYESTVSKRTITYGSLGPCLYKNLMESFSRPELAGYITANLTDLNGNKLAEVEIDWRPPNQSGWGFIKSLIYAWWVKENVRASDGVEGQPGLIIVRFLKVDQDILKSPATQLLSRTALDPEKGPLEEIVISASPLQSSPKTMTEIRALLYQKDQSIPSYQFNVTMGANIFHLDREFEFNLEGK
jgi:hypothetical protein